MSFSSSLWTDLPIGTPWIVHHPENNSAPDLRGQGAKDGIRCEFDDVSLEEMKKIMAGIPARRMRYGLYTGKLYLSEGGRKVVYVQNEQAEFSKPTIP